MGGEKNEPEKQALAADNFDYNYADDVNSLRLSFFWSAGGE